MDCCRVALCGWLSQLRVRGVGKLLSPMRRECVYTNLKACEPVENGWRRFTRNAVTRYWIIVSNERLAPSVVCHDIAGSGFLAGSLWELLELLRDRRAAFRLSSHLLG